MQAPQLTPGATARVVEHMISRAKTAAGLLWLVWSIVAATGPAWAGDPAATSTRPTTSDKEQIVGVFTGTYQDGRPVYRLPPIKVTADRKTELAKIEQEERLARARQARTKIKVAVGHKDWKMLATSPAEESASATCARCVPVAVVR